MKVISFLKVLVLVYSLPAFADICICQYPKTDAEFGAGYKGEIGFYKMGCALWLIKEKQCRKEKVFDINTSLEPYLQKRLKPNEKVRIGYVGHWSHSNEYIAYLQKKIEPLLSTFQVPFEIDNTACLPMKEPEKVQQYLETIPSSETVYLKVKGAQTTSIGMWDKVLINRKKADLMAYGDSRGLKTVYPACDEFLEQRCTGFQVNEVGHCTAEDNRSEELICHKTIKTKANGRLKEKKAKRWLFKRQAKALTRQLLIQNRYR